MTTATATDALTETDALKVIVSAAGGAACPIHEVGPVANHLIGPVSALRPYGHPDYATNNSGAQRSKQAVDRLIRDVASTDAITCSCEDRSRHPLAYVVPGISEGAFIRAHLNTPQAQADLDRAITSVDIDRLTYHAEPRLDALKMLVDRVRGEHGGVLPPLVTDAVIPLVRSLAGPTRWDVRGGYADGWPWPPAWRPGAAFDRASLFMTSEAVAEAVTRRMVKGSR